ncbi:BUD13 homolog [Phlebotomus argentipes]|uniref:BUD13 homolog n=1 Tax=Phlebotomus argentipes TaxID=94469 RepID=UPI002892B562|nr:BUD13 homolog [Phlebotomus argentipes]
MTTKINQKEYLKKYLSGDVGAEKKKKKKKRPVVGQTVKIIDDDVDVSKMEQFRENDLELFTTGEDAPQVVGVIDERPPELRALDFKNNTKWKVISDDNGYESSLTIQQLDRESGRVEKSHTSKHSVSKKRRSSTDSSPVRRKRTPDLSPERRRSRDSSPDRRRKKSPDLSPDRRRKKSPDLSPDRRRKKSPDLSPDRRRRKSPDLSPVRRKRSPDLSPARRRKKHGRDLSPARRRSPDLSPKRRGSPDLSPVRKRSDRRDDLSPPRRSRQESDYKRSRESSSKRRKDSSKSPERRRKRRTPDLSLPRKRHSPEPSSSRKKSPDLSPKRRKSDRDPSPDGGKMKKTLEGKTAGLQDAKSLRIESDKIRKRDAEAFSKMSDEMSGRNATMVLRDKRTGRIRDLEKEAEKERAKERKEQEKKAVYDRWGKGTKQVEDFRQKIEEESYEMSKPLARYSDDADLDNYLKQQEREGDPMLEYIRQKEREKRQDSKVPTVPVYRGPYPENRFGIRPGYRWDGVDRSNGFEKKWFDMQNKKKAIQEEAYRYSTEDL